MSMVQHGLVAEHLQDADGGPQRQAEDGEDAQSAADLLALLCLDEPAVVAGFGEDRLEARGEPVLGLEGEEEVVGELVDVVALQGAEQRCVEVDGACAPKS